MAMNPLPLLALGAAAIFLMSRGDEEEEGTPGTSEADGASDGAEGDTSDAEELEIEKIPRVSSQEDLDAYESRKVAASEDVWEAALVVNEVGDPELGLIKSLDERLKGYPNVLGKTIDVSTVDPLVWPKVSGSEQYDDARDKASGITGVYSLMRVGPNGPEGSITFLFDTEANARAAMPEIAMMTSALEQAGIDAGVNAVSLDDPGFVASVLQTSDSILGEPPSA